MTGLTFGKMSFSWFFRDRPQCEFSLFSPLIFTHSILLHRPLIVLRPWHPLSQAARRPRCFSQSSNRCGVMNGSRVRDAKEARAGRCRLNHPLPIPSPLSAATASRADRWTLSLPVSQSLTYSLCTVAAESRLISGEDCQDFPRRVGTLNLEVCVSHAPCTSNRLPSIASRISVWWTVDRCPLGF